MVNFNKIKWKCLMNSVEKPEEISLVVKVHKKAQTILVETLEDVGKIEN
jgi:hypothetical protein